MHRTFWLETLKEKDHSEDLGADVMISKLFFKDTGFESVDWI
jgi:hypothetical protein